MEEVFLFVDEFRQNDYSHFNQFYELTSKQIFFTALGILKDKDEALDIMQDTYVTFLNNVEKYQFSGSIFAYLTVIARNKAINYYNKEKKVIKNDEYLELLKGTEEVDDSDGVKEILAHLESEEMREIVVYHVLLDYKFKEIAKIMEKPLGTVLWIYNKAMKILREKVSRNEE